MERTELLIYIVVLVVLLLLSAKYWKSGRKKD